MKIDVKKELLLLAEPEYAVFSRRLLPATAPLLGVRLPSLRALARRIVQSGAAEYLRTARDDTFEEIMLQGMVIGLDTVPDEILFSRIKAFLPKIDNWSVCDSFCSGLKFTSREPEKALTFILPFLSDSHPYSVRFALVMLLDYYVDEDHLPVVLSAAGAVQAKEECVQAAAAWALCECCAVFPDKTISYLKQHSICPEILRRSVQKCLDSRRIGFRDKTELRRIRQSLKIKSAEPV